MIATPATGAAEGRPPDTESDLSAPVSVGVLIWLASELMFFAGLFAAYFVLKSANAPDWPPADVHLDTVLSGVATAILLLSSVTMHLCVTSARDARHRRSLGLLVTTIVLGTVFMALQGYDYSQLDFTISTHAYGSIYYLLTGFHGLHVIGGLVLLAVVGWVVYSRGSRAPAHTSLQVASLYWHFVDAVWVVVFLTLFVVR